VAGTDHWETQCGGVSKNRDYGTEEEEIRYRLAPQGSAARRDNVAGKAHSHARQVKASNCSLGVTTQKILRRDTGWGKRKGLEGEETEGHRRRREREIFGKAGEQYGPES